MGGLWGVLNYITVHQYDILPQSKNHNLGYCVLLCRPDFSTVYQGGVKVHYKQNNGMNVYQLDQNNEVINVILYSKIVNSYYRYG